MSKFKPGDRVRLLDLTKTSCPTWDDMLSYSNKIVTLKTLNTDVDHNRWVMKEESYFYFNEAWFVLYNPLDEVVDNIKKEIGL